MNAPNSRKAISFIYNHADEHDVEVMYKALKLRSKVLSEERAAKVEDLVPGTKVTLTHLSPKRLEGLTGVLEKIESKAVVVKLDSPPPWEPAVYPDGSIRVYPSCVEAI